MFTRALVASLIVLTVGCSGLTSTKTNFSEAWNVNSSEEDRAKYCDAAQNEGVEKYINDNMLLVGVFVASQKPEKLAEVNALVKKLYGGSVKGFAAYATEQCKKSIAPTTTTVAPPTKVAPTTTVPPPFKITCLDGKVYVGNACPASSNTASPTSTPILTMEQFWDAFSVSGQADWCYTAQVEGVDFVMVASVEIFISNGYSIQDQVDFWTKVCDL